MPSSLNFTEGEVCDLLQRLGLDKPDPERLAILGCVKSCEVQSGPGSGKTTLLTAKLALLAEQWRDAHRGVCVLSHTNVARREIESRLAASASLRRLLEHPHFIGTFQAFVDQFIALPFLRQRDLPLAAVDNERFARRAWATYECAGICQSAKGWLKHRGDEARLRQIIGGLRYADGSLRVDSANYPAGLPGPESATYNELKNLKHRLAKQGYFRFDDMYAMAERALSKLPYLPATIRDRFAWVFVDELQDTSTVQCRLVEQLFPESHCVVQCFGDKNQTIFDLNEDAVVAPELFGKRPVLPLSSTRRFGSAIAALASPLTAAVKQTLVGHPAGPSRRNTIFLFSRAAIGQVVPRFADLVLAEVPEATWRGREVCVVASRKKVRTLKKDHFPLSLGDYWAGYNPDVAGKPQNPDTFLGFVQEARAQSAQLKTGAEAAHTVMAGVLALIALINETPKPGQPRTRTALRDALMAAGTYPAFQQVLWALTNPTTALSAAGWAAEMPKLTATLAAVIPGPIAGVAQKFLAWDDLVVAPPAVAVIGTPNQYVHTVGGVVLPLRFDSIHGVKGETHAATLLVETFIHPSHDLASLVQVLAGQKHGSELPANDISHCLRAFVALTRASDLIGVALFDEHVSQKEADGMATAGWNVERLK